MHSPHFTAVEAEAEQPGHQPTGGGRGELGCADSGLPGAEDSWLGRKGGHVGCRRADWDVGTERGRAGMSPPGPRSLLQHEEATVPSQAVPAERRPGVEWGRGRIAGPCASLPDFAAAALTTAAPTHSSHPQLFSAGLRTSPG